MSQTKIIEQRRKENTTLTLKKRRQQKQHIEKSNYSNILTS